MKKLLVLLTAGSLVISGATAGLSTARAAETKKPVHTNVVDKDMDMKEIDENFFVYPDQMLPKTNQITALEKFLKNDTKLTKAEKKSLIENYKKLLTTLENIDKISEKISNISSKLTNNWEIEDKLDALSNKYVNLWNKVYENATDEDLAIDPQRFLPTRKKKLSSRIKKKLML